MGLHPRKLPARYRHLSAAAFPQPDEEKAAAKESLMHWLGVIIIGLIVGAIAKLLMPGKDPGGFIITMLLGIAGSVVATWIGRVIGLYREGEAAGFIMSVIGAVILLAIYRMVVGRRRVA
jgi:uncharacterized membrane protein YeaQ/YmgE (transglycosylase-associated protein family)